MKEAPGGWPRVSVAVFYKEPAKAIDWLVRAFDFEVRLKVEGDGGSILHSELMYGGGVVMVATAGGGPEQPEAVKRETGYMKSPGEVGGANTQMMMLYVDDVEAHCVRAREAGARVVSEPTTSDYGEEYWSDRGYECVDLEGHHWWFIQRLRTKKVG